MANQPEPTWEKMSADEVREAQKHLGTDRIQRRHINCTCRRGGRKMFGLVHHIRGSYYLQTKKIDLVKEAMENEGYRPQINKDGVGTAWGAEPAEQQVTKPKPLMLMEEQQENRPVRTGQPIKRGTKTFYVSTTAA